jgi:aspartate kinase
MIVMKFGGTSIQDAVSIRRVCQIVLENRRRHPVVVNSAMGKTTRNLLKIGQLAAGGDSARAQEELKALVAYHQQIIEELWPNSGDGPLLIRLESFYTELFQLKEGVAVLRDLTPRSQDKFLAYGELIATTIIAAALRSAGADAVWCDARELIVTDDRFTGAAPIQALTYSNLKQSIIPLVNNNQVPVIQGYIGSTRDGATTTLGFEGSDFTAALVGAALDAEDVQIWKDVPGVMTADPEIYSDPWTVKRISFEEAAEITFFGAKVLHPSSIAPARQKNIPVHVLNSKQPENRGTELSAEGIISKYPVKSITYKRPVILLVLRNIHYLPFQDYFKMVFDVLDRERLIPYLVNIAQGSVKMVLNTAANLQHLIDDLGQWVQIDMIPNKATVTLVGQALIEHPDIAGRILKCLDEIQLDLISHGASDMNSTVVMNADRVETAVDRLHREFFTERDPELFEILQKGENEA